MFLFKGECSSQNIIYLKEGENNETRVFNYGSS